MFAQTSLVTGLTRIAFQRRDTRCAMTQYLRVRRRPATAHLPLFPGSATSGLPIAGLSWEVARHMHRQAT